MKRVNENLSDESCSKKPCIYPCNNINDMITMDNLPDNMYHLGRENFATVSCFMGHTRIHIRKYVQDSNKVLTPTKEGVSISPAVWDVLQTQLEPILRSSEKQCTRVIANDICISKRRFNGNSELSFQRLFQTKSLLLQFLPDCVVLNNIEVARLIGISDTLTGLMKKQLVNYTLGYFVKQQLKLSEQGFNSDPDNPEGFWPLGEHLTVSFKKSISLKISQIMECYACDEGYEGDVSHDCSRLSLREKFDMYFYKSFYQFDWQQFAKEFVNENVNNVNFNRLVIVHDFFELIDVDEFIHNVEKMYVSLEICLPYNLYRQNLFS